MCTVISLLLFKIPHHLDVTEMLAHTFLFVINTTTTVTFYHAPYSLTNGALQKSVNTCFTAVGRLK